MTESNNKPCLSSRAIKVGPRTIHLGETGSGYPVIMLHGGGPGATGVSNYEQNIEPLAQHFRVLVPDMPGYGQSSKGVDRNDPFGDLAQGILGLMDALDIQRAHLVGNSYGGACALRMALDMPNRVSGLVLMGPGGINTTRSLPTAGLKKLLNYYKGSGPSLEKLRSFIREELVYDGSRISESVIQERFFSSIDPEVIASPPLRAPTNLAAALRMDFTRDRRLRKCRTPALILWGVEDKVNRPSGAQTLHNALSNSDLYLFSKTGHWVQWERAAEFNAVTAAFLQRITSDGKLA